MLDINLIFTTIFFFHESNPKSDYYVTNNIILLKHKEKRLKKNLGEKKQSNLLRQMRHDFICCLRLYTHIVMS